MFGTDGRKEEIDCDDGQEQEQEQEEEERGKLRKVDAPAMDGTDEMSEEERK